MNTVAPTMASESVSPKAFIEKVLPIRIRGGGR
jgi:hypothetical protein